MSLPQPSQQLIENLMALKDDYQAQLLEAEYNANLALEQLSHVNALLVDRLGYQEFAQSLIALRSHYQSLVAQHQQTATHAKAQLAHINALLADQLVVQQLVSMTPSNTVESEAEPLQLPTPESVPQSVPEEADLSIDEHPSASDESKPSEPEIIDDDSKAFSPIKTPMLPQYQHLSKIQAVEKILRDNQGSILHVDYIIRALYGEMDALAIKEEKPRMYDTLTQGTKKGLWVKVPDSPSCYTLALNLVQPDATAKQILAKNFVSSRRTAPARGKVHEQLLPAYQHLNLTAAVETVVYEYPGQILTTEKIAQELFGELSGKALTLAKDKIGKTLWSGTKQGRWQHVPGKIGCYTLDLNKLKK